MNLQNRDYYAWRSGLWKIIHIKIDKREGERNARLGSYFKY